MDLNGHQEGVTVYDQVDDIDKSLKSLVDPEAKTVQEIKDVGAGRLIASVQGENGNIIEVLQDR